MKKTFNPIINLSKKESSTLAKIMNWELKSSINKNKIKSFLKKWRRLIDKIEK
jgi:hypothetical protein